LHTIKNFSKQGQRYKITAFEKNAYGFKIKYNNNRYYELILKDAPDRMIKVTLVNGIPKAGIKINNRKSYLSKVYVFDTDNLISKILYYTLNGTDIKTGTAVTEKIIFFHI
jgi:hypothetical protein